ncbi:DNA-invertase lambdoid prophage e14 [Enterobacter sp. BIDMC 26]|nr:DNA-invertase lambdoid prophage e14 [Enterobacter sp. BIDMC 26]
MQIGYVRVSTNDQNTDLQRQALELAGCEQIFEEKMSGTVASRPALKKLLKALNEGGRWLFGSWTDLVKVCE